MNHIKVNFEWEKSDFGEAHADIHCDGSCSPQAMGAALGAVLAAVRAGIEDIKNNLPHSADQIEAGVKYGMGNTNMETRFETLGTATDDSEEIGGRFKE